MLRKKKYAFGMKFGIYFWIYKSVIIPSFCFDITWFPLLPQNIYIYTSNLKSAY